jgi:hypothetical protein
MRMRGLLLAALLHSGCAHTAATAEDADLVTAEQIENYLEALDDEEDPDTMPRLAAIRDGDAGEAVGWDGMPEKLEKFAKRHHFKDAKEYEHVASRINDPKNQQIVSKFAQRLKAARLRKEQRVNGRDAGQ